VIRSLKKALHRVRRDQLTAIRYGQLEHVGAGCGGKSDRLLGGAVGQGVAEEVGNKLAKPAIRPSQQGLGLGLHIAAEIAKAHGGTITVASGEVETRFTFVMPCRREDVGVEQ